MRLEETFLMLATDSQRWQGFWHWLWGDFHPGFLLQALSDGFFYPIFSL
jgi:hypothetical protein